ncbi:MAG: hypothetical protein DRO11_03640 [Methanobacteriota archaeon]|nr:MAG: hypothetical protein DRO11_03640 [Euryarchaeota archaeon]
MLGETFALLSAVCWAVSAAFYRVGLRGVNPYLANTARSICASLLLATYFLFPGKIAKLFVLPTETLFWIILSGLVGLGLGDTLYLFSLKLIGVSKTVPISSTYPLFSLLPAILFLGENVSANLVLGTCLVVLGLYMVTYQGGGEPPGERGRQILGVMSAVGAAGVWGVSIVMMAKGLRGVDPIMFNAIRMPVLSLLLLGLGLLPLTGGNRFSSLKKQNWLYLALGGVTALILGHTFFVLSLKTIGVSRATPLSSVSPLLGVLVGMFILGEKKDLRVVFGSVVVVFGLGFVVLH